MITPPGVRQDGDVRPDGCKARRYCPHAIEPILTRRGGLRWAILLACPLLASAHDFSWLVLDLTLNIQRGTHSERPR